MSGFYMPTRSRVSKRPAAYYGSGGARIPSGDSRDCHEDGGGSDAQRSDVGVASLVPWWLKLTIGNLPNHADIVISMMFSGDANAWSYVYYGWTPIAVGQPGPNHPFPIAPPTAGYDWFHHVADDPGPPDVPAHDDEYTMTDPGTLQVARVTKLGDSGPGFARVDFIISGASIGGQAFGRFKFIKNMSGPIPGIMDALGSTADYAQNTDPDSGGITIFADYPLTCKVELDS